MSSNEKKIAIQAIVKLIDVAILNNEDSCKFKVSFERRLDASRLFHKTPYDKFEIQNISLFDSILEKQFLEISNGIKIESVLPMNISGGEFIHNRNRLIYQGERRNLILLATSNNAYRRNRLSLYSNRKFMKKVLLEHSGILEKIYAILARRGSSYNGYIQVSCSYIGPFTDCDEYCVRFLELGMNNLKDSFQTYQMTLAFIDFLNRKGIVCSMPTARFAYGEIVFEFNCKKSLESSNRKKDW